MRISLSVVAREAGVSASTVSRALRGLACVDAETQRRVSDAAERLGYVRDPLLASAFAFVRRTDKPVYRESLAFLAVEPPMPPEEVTRKPRETRPWMAGIWQGVTMRAGALGYRAEAFRLPAGGRAQRTLARQLRARGIRGVVFGPRSLADSGEVDACWASFSSVEIGHTLEGVRGARIDRLLSDDMERLLANLHERGYRRIGLAMQETDEVRRHWAVFAACLLFERRKRNGVRVWSLFEDGAEYSPAGLPAWIRKRRPDVIIGNGPEPLDWLLAEGWPVPDRIGVCRIDCVEGRPESGLRINYETLGASAVTQLASDLERSEPGVADASSAESPRAVLGIPSMWHDGMTLRARPSA